jgi:hypothetical protein
VSFGLFLVLTGLEFGAMLMASVMALGTRVKTASFYDEKDSQKRWLNHHDTHSFIFT